MGYSVCTGLPEAVEGLNYWRGLRCLWRTWQAPCVSWPIASMCWRIILDSAWFSGRWLSMAQLPARLAVISARDLWYVTCVNTSVQLTQITWETRMSPTTARAASLLTRGCVWNVATTGVGLEAILLRWSLWCLWETLCQTVFHMEPRNADTWRNVHCQGSGDISKIFWFPAGTRWGKGNVQLSHA